MAAPNIVVVDYHKGNLSSVVRGLARAGAAATASDDPAAIRGADGLVIPGVGALYDAITFMNESGQAAAIVDAVATGTPLLGICLGLQLLYDRGDEGVPADVSVAPTINAYGTELVPATVFEDAGKRWVRGLGLLHGSCTRLESDRLKVPHVGWDQVHLTDEGRQSMLLAGFAEGANMYFTHSFAVDDDACDDNALACTHYVRSFPCVAHVGNVYGCQFHPEKSSGLGLRILKNFVCIVEGASAEAKAADSAAKVPTLTSEPKATETAAGEGVHA